MLADRPSTCFRSTTCSLAANSLGHRKWSVDGTDYGWYKGVRRNDGQRRTGSACLHWSRQGVGPAAVVVLLLPLGGYLPLRSRRCFPRTSSSTSSVDHSEVEALGLEFQTLGPIFGTTHGGFQIQSLLKLHRALENAAWYALRLRLLPLFRQRKAEPVGDRGNASVVSIASSFEQRLVEKVADLVNNKVHNLIWQIVFSQKDLYRLW